VHKNSNGTLPPDSPLACREASERSENYQSVNTFRFVVQANGQRLSINRTVSFVVTAKGQDHQSRKSFRYVVSAKGQDYQSVKQFCMIDSAKG
jgi:hypothetical protein